MPAPVFRRWLGFSHFSAVLSLTTLATPAIATTEGHDPYHLLHQLGRVLVWVENEYVDPVSRDKLIEGSLKGMVSELDPHSSYLSPEDYEIFQGDTEGRFGGIGVEVDFGDEYSTVVAPIVGSPAERAGIRPRDRILAIDHMPIRGKSPADVVRQMRGVPGTSVLLTLRRPDTDQILHVSLVRQIINVASVASRLLKSRIFYLRIKTFQTGTHTEFLDQFADLRAKNHGDAAGLILDMRNNPGGLVHEASSIADEFLSSGVIFTTRRRGRIVDEVRADSGGTARRGPLIVLVNEGSASAAELVAGALQDNRRARVVGVNTFGKGSVQTIIDLPGGAGLRLTALRYYTPSGRAIQAQGIRPDILVPSPRVREAAVIREENLANHLPAVEGAAPKLIAPKSPETGGTASPSAPLVLSDVPFDPEQGSDVALRVAYRLLLGAPLSTP